MQRLIPYLLTGLIVVLLPQNLLAEDPAGPPGPSNAQPPAHNPEILFNRLDANHDGFITQDELPPAMPEMFKQLLLLADSNGDGKITLAELTAALDKHRPGPNNEPPGGRSRGGEAQTGGIPAAPFGGRFGGGFGGGPDGMNGPPFARRGPAPGVEQPQNPAGAGAREGSVQVEAYRVDNTDPQMALKVLQTLLAGAPDVRMDVDPKSNHLIVLARPAQHEAIRATLVALQQNSPAAADDKEKPAAMPGPPFGRRGGEDGRQRGPGFGGFGGSFGMGGAWMDGRGFDSPGRGPAARMDGPPFGPGRPDGPPAQMAGRDPGPRVGPPWARAASFYDASEEQPWARPGFGPPHHWAAFGPMQQHSWRQEGFWGPPGPRWRQNDEWAPARHWRADGPGPRHPWADGQNWYGQLLSNNQRPQHPGFNLKTLFDRLDANHDNQLSFEEFSRGVRHLLHMLLPDPGPGWARPVGWFGGQGFGHGFGPPARFAMGNPTGNYAWPGHRAVSRKIAGPADGSGPDASWGKEKPYKGD